MVGKDDGRIVLHEQHVAAVQSRSLGEAWTGRASFCVQRGERVCCHGTDSFRRLQDYRKNEVKVPGKFYKVLYENAAAKDDCVCSAQ